MVKACFDDPSALIPIPTHSRSVPAGQRQGEFPRHESLLFKRTKKPDEWRSLDRDLGTRSPVRDPSDRLNRDYDPERVRAQLEIGVKRRNSRRSAPRVTPDQYPLKDGTGIDADGMLSAERMRDHLQRDSYHEGPQLHSRFGPLREGFRRCRCPGSKPVLPALLHPEIPAIPQHRDGALPQWCVREPGKGRDRRGPEDTGQRRQGLDCCLLANRDPRVDSSGVGDDRASRSCTVIPLSTFNSGERSLPLPGAPPRPVIRRSALQCRCALCGHAHSFRVIA